MTNDYSVESCIAFTQSQCYKFSTWSRKEWRKHVRGVILLLVDHNHSRSCAVYLNICCNSCCFTAGLSFAPFSITSFRCSFHLVVALTRLLDALVWGKCRDGAIIKVPRVESLEFPRDFVSNGPYRNTGGAVHPGRRKMIIFISFTKKNQLIWNVSKQKPRNQVSDDSYICIFDPWLITSLSR